MGHYFLDRRYDQDVLSKYAITHHISGHIVYKKLPTATSIPQAWFLGPPPFTSMAIEVDIHNRNSLVYTNNLIIFILRFILVEYYLQHFQLSSSYKLISWSEIEAY